MSEIAPFIHLHLHTEYSLLDGAIRVKKLFEKAKAYNMGAVAITDHGNMFGVIEFYREAKKNGIKPIIGCEIYVAKGAMSERKSDRGKGHYYHLTLLSENNEGYQNLLKIVSAGYLEGFYYKPRVDKDFLRKHSNGLIALSGCLSGEINSFLKENDIKTAQKSLEEYVEIFGTENFFIEIQNHGLEIQNNTNKLLASLATQNGLGLVATNDVHYLEKHDHLAHDVMLCIGTGSYVHQENRMHSHPETYFKSPDEMAKLFPEYPEAIENTVKIANRCEVGIEFGVLKYPSYQINTGESSKEYLERLCLEGIEKKYKDSDIDRNTVMERFNYELDIIEKMGFLDYFLIVWDFIHFARKNAIPVGPGRGSAAGSIIAYLLGICDICPLSFGLLFERFINPERISPPDIDIDFCQSRRGEVLDYVRKKYSQRAVAHIITYGKLGAKSVIRDVGRVLGWSYSEADILAKMIPNELGITLEKSAKKNEKLKERIDNEPKVRELWDFSTYLEGMTRGTGVHAAGIIIANKDLSELVPLFRGNEGEVVTQYSMAPLHDLGLLKMDFLGLKTLTVIQNCIDLIHKNEEDFDLSKISLKDNKTFELLNNGETIGVFQLESGGMTSLCKKFSVENVGDIIALIALYRPGPMDLIPDYIERKKGRKKITYLHPLLEEVCSDTFGIMIYQEQVQQAAKVIAGYTLGEADLLRRAMGKKDVKKMSQERKRFVEGAKKCNAINDNLANAIFDLLEKFAGYGFNKSHSAAYGMISYQTAYLKANYPVEFMSAILSNEVNNTDKITTYIKECSRMGIEILAPNVNKSQILFSPEKSNGKRGIRFGLSAIKNVGIAPMTEVIKIRNNLGEFKDMRNFVASLDSRNVNKKILESLVCSGAFDFTGEKREQLFYAIEETITSSQSIRRDREQGQGSLFSLEDFTSTPNSKSFGKECPTWERSEILSKEKELLGFYVTGHPLDPYKEVFKKNHIMCMEDVREVLESEKKVTALFGGLIMEFSLKYSKKNNKPFAIIKLEDYYFEYETLIFGDVASKHEELLVVGNVVQFKAKIELRGDEKRITIYEFFPIDEKQKGKKFVKKKKENVVFPNELNLRIDMKEEVVMLHHIKNILKVHPGSSPVFLHFMSSKEDRKVTITLNKKFYVKIDSILLKKLDKWIPKKKGEVVKA